MSTRSYVGYLTKSGSYKYIYVHSDGYISGVGQILFNHYDLKKTMELVKLGAASVIEKNLAPMGNSGHNFENRQEGVCVFYHRDRGDPKVDTKTSTMKVMDLDVLLDGIDYVYVIDQKGDWYVTNEEHQLVLLDLYRKMDIKK